MNLLTTMDSDKYSDIPEQKLFLLMKRTERISGKRYLRIVVLDYINGSILTIYDNNGEPDLKLHSWNKDADALREQTVIKAKLIYDSLQEYAAKVISPFETISKGGNLKLFLQKIYVQGLLAVLEGRTNLLYPVSKPDILEDADNISIDQSFYNTGLPSVDDEEDMIFDVYWRYADDESASGELSISEDDNLSFEWSFDNRIQISFREGEYQLIDVSGSMLEGKHLTLLNRKVLVADEKINKENNQGKYFNGCALIRRTGEFLAAERLYGNFEKTGKPHFIDILTNSFQYLEDKILMLATKDNEDDEFEMIYEIQYGEIGGLEEESPAAPPLTMDNEIKPAEEKRGEENRFEAIRAEIAGDYPDYSVIDVNADDFATEYGKHSGVVKKPKPNRLTKEKGSR